MLYLVNALFQPLADDGSGDVQVTIPANSSASDVADILEREGVVDSAFFFEVRTRLANEDLQAGTFTLQEGMPYGDAIKALSETPAAPRTVKITIPEGRARRETAPLVRKTGLSGSYLAASEKARGFSTRKYGAPRSAPSLEGFLFPATYELEPDASSRDLVAKQLETFEREIDKVSMRRARQRNLSTYDVLIIASMIDREATLDKERRLVSAVIHNRLREDMPLGIDATIRYATRNWTRPLRQSELAIDSPYNTRRRIGLPPTPIGSPGLASIRAAANPANVDYLYYVVKPNGDGAHNFSSSDAEFQRDVEAYKRERAARGGKDPSSSDGNVTSALKRFGVLGWPVAHSRSPAMHRAAYEALGLRDWHYQKLPVPPEVFEETVRALPAAGYHGANVTIPHKEAALALADEATEAAREIGAANTLTFRSDGTIHADNTDAPGLIAAIGDPLPREALVLGAGGSARAAVWALRAGGGGGAGVEPDPGARRGARRPGGRRADRRRDARQLHERRPGGSRGAAGRPAGLRGRRRPGLPRGRHGPGTTCARRGRARGGRPGDPRAAGRAEPRGAGPVGPRRST